MLVVVVIVDVGDYCWMVRVWDMVGVLGGCLNYVGAMYIHIFMFAHEILVFCSHIV
jgi:hypothetical protein